jgi:NADP-reducing hydrogenase subunit HndA
MAKRKTGVPFQGTAEQKRQLLDLIAGYKNERGALMPVLQQAQEIYGYLPVEVQMTIAEGFGIPLEEVYGVVTFYGQFNLNPKGKYKISVCLGTACYVKGSGQILERIEEKLGIKSGEVTADGKFSLDATRCLGACSLAPIMTINEDIYGCLTPADINGILDKYSND